MFFTLFRIYSYKIPKKLKKYLMNKNNLNEDFRDRKKYFEILNKNLTIMMLY